MPSQPEGQTPLTHDPAVPFQQVIDSTEWRAENTAAIEAYQFQFAVHADHPREFAVADPWAGGIVGPDTVLNAPLEAS